MWKTVQIKQGERGLLFAKGRFNRLLTPGSHRLNKWRKEELQIVNISDALLIDGVELPELLRQPELERALEVVRVDSHEYVLLIEDGRFAGLLTAGIYAYWRTSVERTMIRVDYREPELPAQIDSSLLSFLTAMYQLHDVEVHEAAFLYYDNVLQRELQPGRYRFWKKPVKVEVRKVDLRQQQLELNGQEMMTEDKVTLRLNFVCQYRVENASRVLELKQFEDQIYVQLQLVLREYIGTLKLDELLRSKQEIAPFVLSKLNEQAGEMGVKFMAAGVKDIILPGEIKEILNTVLLAEKRAQANLIMRREETASTRSLLNTAKLMEDNQTLYRLKEMETLERICERIGHISLTGGGNLLGQLNTLLGAGNRGQQE